MENTLFPTAERRRQETKCTGSLTVMLSKNSSSQEVAQVTSYHID